MCIQLEEGVPIEKISQSLDPDPGYAKKIIDFFIEFAIENNWITKEQDGKYSLTAYGKEFVNTFLPKNRDRF